MASPIESAGIMAKDPTFVVPPEQEAEWIKADANEVPSPQAWRKLILGLRRAREIAAQDYENKLLPPGMTELSQVIDAVHSFLNAHPVIQRNALCAPLLRMQYAIGDLSKGQRPTLFTPRDQGKGGLHKRVALGEIEAIAARALDELMKPGPAKMLAEEASRLVAHTIETAKLPGHQKCTPTTVRKWRQLIMGALNGRDIKLSPEILMRWHAPFPPEAGDTSEAHAKFLLDYLGNSPALRWV